jgi:hypothetical protein
MSSMGRQTSSWPTVVVDGRLRAASSMREPGSERGRGALAPSPDSPAKICCAGCATRWSRRGLTKRHRAVLPPLLGGTAGGVIGKAKGHWGARPPGHAHWRQHRAIVQALIPQARRVVSPVQTCRCGRARVGAMTGRPAGSIRIALASHEAGRGKRSLWIPRSGGAGGWGACPRASRDHSTSFGSRSGREDGRLCFQEGRR